MATIACVGVATPIALAGTAGAVGTTSTAPASAPVTAGPVGEQSSADSADLPVTEIDVTALAEGDATDQPWADDENIHVGDTTYSVGENDLRSLTAVDEDTAVANLATHTADNEIVLLRDGDTTTIARDLALSSTVAVSEDGTKLVWSSWERQDDNQNPIGDTTVNEYDLEADAITREHTVSDAIVEPSNYLNGKAVFADQSGGHAYAWDPIRDEPPQPLEDVRTVSAEGGNRSAVILNDEAPTTQVVSGDGDVQWTTEEYRIVEFSEDSQFALAVDARSDGLGTSEYVVLDALRGTPQGTISTDLSTQATAEADGAFVFDASNDGQQALVRFRPNTDADPELVTPTADWPNPPEERPYLLSRN